MKQVIIFAVVFIFAASAFARGGGHSGGRSGGSHRASSGHSSGHHASGRASGQAKKSVGSHAVAGYTKRNGTRVAPAHATNADETKTNNWTNHRNVNPYTGKKGTKAD
jgi:hypothetical protein